MKKPKPAAGPVRKRTPAKPAADIGSTISADQIEFERGRLEFERLVERIAVERIAHLLDERAIRHQRREVEQHRAFVITERKPRTRRRVQHHFALRHLLIIGGKLKRVGPVGLSIFVHVLRFDGVIARREVRQRDEEIHHR